MISNWNNMTDMEQLAIMQSLFKILAEKVSTKDPDSIRSQVDEHLLRSYEVTGAKSYDLNINGKKVGSMSVSVSKETSKNVVDLTDPEAFTIWIEDNPDLCQWYADEHGQEFAEWVMSQTGELPDGVAGRTVITPPAVKGTTIRVDPDKVANALGNQLEPVVAGLLAG